MEDTFAFTAKLNSGVSGHSQYVALLARTHWRTASARRRAKRPSVDAEDPALRIRLFITGEHCSVSLDSSGDSLHKRGYREQTNLAPLNEVLAAGMVLLSGWDRMSNFVDPMCGSGTLLIEAALIAGTSRRAHTAKLRLPAVERFRR
ncbi:MAG: hypothetical protein IPF78_11490 [Flavobacteriales bacterium]|nr:hypothetical protein [Flavobacteriales bacterium]